MLIEEIIDNPTQISSPKFNHLFTYRASKSKGLVRKPIPAPLPVDTLDIAATTLHNKKINALATVIQAQKLKGARTSITADDMAVAFHMAHSKVIDLPPSIR